MGKKNLRDESQDTLKVMNTPRAWIVQKFGGTSVGKYPDNVIQIIKSYNETRRVAVVCSAVSSISKSEGTTTRLLKAAHTAESSNLVEGHEKLINGLQNDHVTMAQRMISSEEILQDLLDKFNEEFKQIRKILRAVHDLNELTSTAQDNIVSKGEKLSALYIVAALNDSNVPARMIDLSSILKFPSDTPLDKKFYSKLSQAFAQAIHNDHSNQIPVITGYFGYVPHGLLASVGRGYTDLCAALVAVGLEAQELQIWKEVDGIFTADPRKVPTAQLIPKMAPCEAAELTFFGSEVIHPFTMEQVIQANIPVRIVNVTNLKGHGTVIEPETSQPWSNQSFCRLSVAGSRPPRTVASPDDGGAIREVSKGVDQGNTSLLKRPTAVTVKGRIVILNVRSNHHTGAHGFLKNIFAILDKWHLSVDLVSSSEVCVSMALHSTAQQIKEALNDNSSIREVSSPELSRQNPPPHEYMNRAAVELINDKDLRGAVYDLLAYGSVDMVDNLAIISLVGKQLNSLVGISGKFFTLLGANNINVEMISQGSSEINISCVIAEQDADRALSVVHTNLFTFY